MDIRATMETAPLRRILPGQGGPSGGGGALTTVVAASYSEPASARRSVGRLRR